MLVQVLKFKSDWNGISKAQVGTISASNYHRTEILGQIFLPRPHPQPRHAGVVQVPFRGKDTHCPMGLRMATNRMVL